MILNHLKKKFIESTNNLGIKENYDKLKKINKKDVIKIMLPLLLSTTSTFVNANNSINENEINKQKQEFNIAYDVIVENDEIKTFNFNEFKGVVEKNREKILKMPNSDKYLIILSTEKKNQSLLLTNPELKPVINSLGRSRNEMKEMGSFATRINLKNGEQSNFNIINIDSNQSERVYLYDESKFKILNTIEKKDFIIALHEFAHLTDEQDDIKLNMIKKNQRNENFNQELNLEAQADLYAAFSYIKINKLKDNDVSDLFDDMIELRKQSSLNQGFKFKHNTLYLLSNIKELLNENKSLLNGIEYLNQKEISEFTTKIGNKIFENLNELDIEKKYKNNKFYNFGSMDIINDIQNYKENGLEKLKVNNAFVNRYPDLETSTKYAENIEKMSKILDSVDSEQGSYAKNVENTLSYLSRVGKFKLNTSKNKLKVLNEYDFSPSENRFVLDEIFNYTKVLKLDLSINDDKRNNDLSEQKTNNKIKRQL